MSDLAARLRAAIDALGEGETYAERNLFNLAGDAADALDKAEAYGETMYKNWQLALNQRDYAEAKFAAEQRARGKR